MKTKFYPAQVIIEEDLKRDLRTYIGSFCAGLASKAREELYATTKNAIEMFYADYTPRAGNVNTSYHWVYTKPQGVPKSYRRHYTNFLTQSFKKYYENKHHSIYRGGVLLSTETMKDIYQDTLTEVFDMVYAGYHGVSSGFYEGEGGAKTFVPTPVMQPSPMELIKAKRRDICDNPNQYYDYGLARAVAQTYKTFTQKE